MVDNNRKDVDKLVSNLNLLGDVVFYTYSSDRNRISVLIREDDNLYNTVKFSLAYIKDDFLEFKTLDNNDKDFTRLINQLTTVLSTMKNMEINDNMIGLPDYYYYKADPDNNISTVFGWDFKNKVIQKKKDI